MKRLLVLLFLLVPAGVWAQTAALPVQQCIQPGTQATVSGLLSTNYQMGIVPSCTVTVYLTGTTNIATTTPQTPLTASPTGQFLIYAPINAGYDVVLSGGISPNVYVTPYAITDVFPGGSSSVIPVTLFGAIGDCTINGSSASCTDNSIALQSALNYCYVAGCSLLFPNNPSLSPSVVASISNISGGSFSGVGSCLLTYTNGGGTGGEANIAFVTSGSLVGASINAFIGGYGYTSAPTQGTWSNGTATCTGTATFTSILTTLTIYYTSKTLDPLGVSMYGSPGAASDVNSPTGPKVAVRGAPLNDVFAPGDPSSVGYRKPIHRFAIRDLSIYVDDSQDASSSGANLFPNRLPGRTVFDGAMSTGGSNTILTSTHSQFQQGDVGQNIIVYGAGAGGVNLTTTIASVQSVSQATLTVGASTSVTNAQIYISVMGLSATQTIGNCAWAYDASSYINGYAAAGAAGEDFSNSYVATTSGVSNQNNTCGFFFQGGANTYTGTWDRLYVKSTFGFAFVPANNNTTGSINPTGGIADLNIFSGLYITSPYPFLAYDGNDNTIRDWELENVVVGPQILNGWGTEPAPSGWSIDIAEEEPQSANCAAGSQSYRIAGQRTVVNRIQAMACNSSGSPTFEIDTAGATFNSVTVGKGEQINFGGSGTDIIATSCLSTSTPPTVSAGVFGTYKCLAPTSYLHSLPPSSPIAGGAFSNSVGNPAISRYRVAFNRTAAFIDKGASSYYLNGEDIWWWPGEVGISSGVIPTVVDSTSPTGSAWLLAGGASTTYTLMSSNEVNFVIGQQIPAGKMRIYFSAKAIGGTQVFDMSATQNAIPGTNPTTPLAGCSIAPTLTTSYTLNSCDVDTTAFNTYQFGIKLGGNSLTNSVQVAWVAVKPWNTDLTTTSMTLGYGSTAITGSQGNGGYIQQTTNGAKINGDFVSFDSGGNTVDSGSSSPTGATLNYWQTAPQTSTSSATATLGQNGTTLWSVYLTNGGSYKFSDIAALIKTADNSGNLYDIGVYGPNCYNGATGVTLLWHTGPIAGSSILSGSTGSGLIGALSGAPVTNSLSASFYCIAATTSAASPTLAFGLNSSGAWVPFGNGATPGGGTGTTSAATLNSTITAPVLSWQNNITFWEANY